jgi:hypothetical protein
VHNPVLAAFLQGGGRRARNPHPQLGNEQQGDPSGSLAV